MGSWFSSEVKPEVRLVLVGKTGGGKSASGNTLIGRKGFHSTASAAGVTEYCKKETTSFEGQSLAVVDTPGLFDTKMTKEEVEREIKKCISFAAPGPHVFLVVIQLNRFTDEEQQTVKLIQDLFGEESSDYTMVLFTHGDDLEHEGKPLEAFINENKKLCDFVRQCHGGYHVFNNRKRDPGQVRELLKKINLMVQRNNERFFTNQMLEEAERAIQDRIRKILEKKQMEEREARRWAEEMNKFIDNVVNISGKLIDVCKTQ